MYYMHSDIIDSEAQAFAYFGSLTSYVKKI